MIAWLCHLIFGHRWAYTRRVTKRTCTYCGKVQYQVAYGDERLYYGLIWRSKPSVFHDVNDE